MVATLSCSQKDNLTEVPLSFLSSDNVLNSKQGFEQYITGIHEAARTQLNMIDYNDGFINLQQERTWFAMVSLP